MELVEMEKPFLKEGELLVKVQAAAVNRTDILTRENKGGYDSTPVLGVEVAGIVVDANGVSSFSEGEEVMGLVNGGGYAEFAVLPADRAMKKPCFLRHNRKVRP